MTSYIQGPEPTGLAVMSSLVEEAGTTRTMARRSFSREKFGTVVLTVTVVSSLASTEAMGASIGM